MKTENSGVFDPKLHGCNMGFKMWRLAQKLEALASGNSTKTDKNTRRKHTST